MKRPLGLLIIFCTLNVPFARAQEHEVLTTESSEGISDRVYPYWTAFFHPRFGYKLPVPPGVRAVGVPENLTEAKFVSPDGGFVVSAWGGISPEPGAFLIESHWMRAQNKPGRDITYQRKSRSWFVVSGTDGAGNEFYEKFIIRGDHVAALTITHPRSRLREFRPWVEQIEDGFGAVALARGSPEIAPRLLSGTFPRNSDPREVPEISRTVIPSSPGSSQSPGTDRSFSNSRAVEETKVDLTPPPKKIDKDFPPTRLEPVKSEDSPPVKTPAEKPSTGATTPVKPDLPLGQKVVGKPGFVYSPFLAEKRLVDVVDIAPGTKVKCPYTEKVFRVP